MSERGFLIFTIFFFFFGNFLARVEYERNLGLNFFSLFFGLSHPVLAKNNGGKRFFDFCYFFPNFLSRVEYGRNSGLKFFSHFHNLSHPGLYKNSVGLMLFNLFLIFLIFFYGKRSPARVGTEFGTKFFFSLSRTLLTRFGKKKCRTYVF